ncbi:uncharacterized protein LOC144438292 [Glandiceps talaboti]
MDDSSAIESFLEPLDLMQYLEIFQTKGYDRETDFSTLTDVDLDELGITDDDHRGMILHAAEHYELSDQYKVYQFLRDHELDYYYKHFIDSEYTCLDTLSRMDVNEDTLDDLEITLPGHKKRLQLAVSKLRKRRRLSDEEAESPVAIGYWGRPAALEDAKYDFLCLRSTIKSTKANTPSFELEFMVDSGSDVVTVRQSILDQLDLELIGTIQSRGVHATVEKQLYKAVLGVGNFNIEIEVMAEPYESIGNRVLRHFRHFIDLNRHIWLQGQALSSPSVSSMTFHGEPSTSTSTSASIPETPSLSQESTTTSTSQSRDSTSLARSRSSQSEHREDTPGGDGSTAEKS